MATPWSVPLMWQGRTVVVMASGPSLTPPVVELVRRSSAPVLVTNNTHQAAPWADMLYAADLQWWEVHREATRAFKGLKVSASDPPYEEVKSLRITDAEGYDPDPECIRTGGNSGYACVHIAAQAGAKRILLCGFDMRGGHWHPDHERPLRTTPPITYDRWIARFGTLAPEMRARGIDVVNCTPRSALRCFPLADLEGCLDGPTGL